LSEQGIVPATIQGRIKFENIKFRYPQRPDVAIMDETSITIEPGQTVALVGESGCGVYFNLDELTLGKSTLIWLLERFYDPNSGRVLLDDVDIRDLNIRWVRQQFGLVTQEPKLFSCSIRDNIAYGRLTVKKDNVIDFEATQQEIQDAAKAANIHDFIEKLPEKYDTLAGEKVNICWPQNWFMSGNAIVGWTKATHRNRTRFTPIAQNLVAGRGDVGVGYGQ
jgi:ABC-type multidrug transport system fused ATPase/permease subunit